MNGGLQGNRMKGKSKIRKFNQRRDDRLHKHEMKRRAHKLYLLKVTKRVMVESDG